MLVALACTILLLALTKMVWVVVSLICWMLILNGLYHVILGIRSLLVRSFGVFRRRDSGDRCEPSHFLSSEGEKSPPNPGSLPPRGVIHSKSWPKICFADS